MSSAPDRLAHLRHDLRTPASHIVGYAELLREIVVEQHLEGFLADLEPIEAAGKRLVELIRDRLAPERWARGEIDLRELHAELRTPLNHVVGYTEMLLEQAEAGRGELLVADLQRIHAAAREFLQRVEQWLTPEMLQATRSPGPAVVSTIRPTALALARPEVTLPKTLEGPPGIRGRVLVADDDAANRDLLTRRLQQLGFAAETVVNGEEVLLRLGREPLPEVVLLDVVMPGIDGLEALGRLKAEPRLRDLPVIMLSALDEMDSVVRCLLAGAEDYLAKPVNTVLLRARLEACLEKNRLRRQEAAHLAALEWERRTSETLLLNILPGPIATRLKRGETTIVDGFPEVTVLFADLVGFTALSTRMDSAGLVALLDEIFSAFDAIAEGQGLEKIKTIGDAYMVVGGVPTPRPDHAEAVAEAALRMLAHVERHYGRREPPIQLRLGLSTGPVIAGVIGRHKFTYDLWGDTVNTASRMESAGLPGRIQVSASTYQRLKHRYAFTARGEVEIKGKGPLPTWWLEGRGADPDPATEAQAKS